MLHILAEFSEQYAREAESIEGVVTDNFLFYGLQEFERQKEPANHFDGANGKLLLNYSILTMLIKSTNDYKAVKIVTVVYLGLC